MIPRPRLKRTWPRSNRITKIVLSLFLKNNTEENLFIKETVMDRIDQKLLICLVVILLAAGCSTRKVERVAVGQKIDVSGDWNDYANMQVAEEMIKDSLSGHWLSDYNNLKKHSPTV